VTTSPQQKKAICHDSNDSYELVKIVADRISLIKKEISPQVKPRFTSVTSQEPALVSRTSFRRSLFIAVGLQLFGVALLFWEFLWDHRVVVGLFCSALYTIASSVWTARAELRFRSMKTELRILMYNQRFIQKDQAAFEEYVDQYPTLRYIRAERKAS